MENFADGVPALSSIGNMRSPGGFTPMAAVPPERRFVATPDSAGMKVA